ncbi:ABC transporter ATP-binding protein [Limnohabitans planktonicus]|uniref:ABC transporter ATP-binding protein n=1 Tax=Limnohabitans planktonicus II-D5 TaxID=1293045 RepID=A0A2T7UHG9_9BURK|nr:dipeptide ABC transporter ATP-binding protein [Limnohabitans planktonicus]PVE44117.1 ABC transporter ATP-binding protein [Limnohabitans planktonicus II-D5]
MNNTTPLLQLKQLRVAFGDTEVVHGIDLSIQPGERLALVGESGSGKSVTALSVLRLMESARLSGQVLWQGQDLLQQPLAEMQRIRGDDIAMIFQEPMTALNPLMTVGQQISEVLQLKKGHIRRDADLRAVALLGETGIDEPERRFQAYPHQLSGGQRQRAMMAMALACEPKLLLADEPTTALDASLRLQMLALLSALQEKTGMAVLLITHDLALVRHFAHRVAVMEKGHLVEQGELRAVFSSPQHAYTQKLLDSRPRRDDLHEADAQAKPASVVQARGLRVRYPMTVPGWRGWFQKNHFTALQGADFSISAGTTLGVMGESGSGKSSLAQAVLGLMPFEGEVTFAGDRWQGQPRQDKALRQRVQVVFQDPYGSLSPRMTVGEIVSEGLKLHQPQLTAAQIEQRVLATLAEVGLSSDDFPQLLNRYPHAFSGGQRQRIALARALVVEPALLVLDEPTSALDVTVQKQILTLLKSLQVRRGIAYLMITHDVDVLRAMAHQVLVLQGGKVVESGPAMQVLGQPQHAYTRQLIDAFPD